MHEKEKDLISAFLRGEVDRRGMLKGLGAMGVTAGAGGTLLNMMSSRAMAADFDWKKHSGKTVKLLLNKHPYADAMIANLQAFKDLTGMDVKYDVFPEDVYFDKVTAALSSGSTEYDAFMTGAYMTWTYGPAGWITDLKEMDQRSGKGPIQVMPGDDFLPGVKNSCAWNGQPGGALGSDDAKQWCIPWAFEQNNITYNKAMFDKAGVSVPKNLDDMIAVAAKLQKDVGGIYGIGVRGSRSWGDDPSGLPLGLFELQRKGPERRRRQAVGGDGHGRFQGVPCQMGADDPGKRPEGLVDLYLVSGRYRSGRRRVGDDFRRRLPGLLHEWRRQQDGRTAVLCRLHRQPGCNGLDAEHLDLVARHVQLFQGQGPPPWYFLQWANRSRTRDLRRHQDGLCRSGPPVGLEG